MIDTTSCRIKLQEGACDKCIYVYIRCLCFAYMCVKIMYIKCVCLYICICSMFMNVCMIRRMFIICMHVYIRMYIVWMHMYVCYEECVCIKKFGSLRRTDIKKKNISGAECGSLELGSSCYRFSLTRSFSQVFMGSLKTWLLSLLEFQWANGLMTHIGSRWALLKSIDKEKSSCFHSLYRYGCHTQGWWSDSYAARLPPNVFFNYSKVYINHQDTLLVN